MAATGPYAPGLGRYCLAMPGMPSWLLMRLTLLWALLCITARAQTLTLQTLVEPSGCRGGELCDTQPQVVVINTETQQIDFFFSGDVYAQVDSSPSGYEQLYVGQECDLDSCGQQVSGSLAQASFVNGIATFSDLHFTGAGAYVLKFVGRSALGNPFASALTEEVLVEVGEAYRLALQTFVGTALGGLPFSANPVVAVVDRGGNVLPSHSTGSVQARVTASPDDTALSLQLQPLSSTTVPITGGVAGFLGLWLNVSGHGYQITFSTNESLASSVLVSDTFDVVTGQPAKLALQPGFEPAFTPKRAGEFFAVPPRVRLLDAGGNFVHWDNSSALRVRIQHDPSGRASVGPASSTWAVARQGVVTFSALWLDTSGQNFTLRFSLFNYSALGKGFFPTNVSLVSERFSVLTGPPRRLVLVREAADAWAGNQAFGVQPILQLQDFGGNVLSDFTSTVKATLLPSLAVGLGNDRRVNTTLAPQSAPYAVQLALDNGIYGAGEVVDVWVLFSMYVWVRDADSEGLSNYTTGTPVLRLNVTNADPAAPPPLAVLVGSSQQTRRLVFRYVVQEGDRGGVGGGLLDWGAGALELNGTEIVDGNRHPVNTSLPPHSHSVSLDTAKPTVTSLACNTSAGEYGAGQVFEFYATFDQPVSVLGLPFLAFANGTDDVTRAYYSHSLNGDTVLAFLLQVGGQFPTSGVDLTLVGGAVQFANLTNNATLVQWVNASSPSFNASLSLTNESHYQYDYRYSSLLGGSIRRRSSKPSTHADLNLTLLQGPFNAALGVVIDTSPPQLDASYGLQTEHVSGLFYPGEEVLLTVRFDKQVQLTGVGPHLLLDAGPHGAVQRAAHGQLTQQDYAGRAFVSRLLPDNLTVEFLYVVEQYTNTSALDVAVGGMSLVVPDSASLRRQSTHPCTAANLSTTVLENSVQALRSFQVGVTGYAPTVLSVSLLETFPGTATVLYPDDWALVQVNFSAAVVAPCSPVLVMAHRFFREAVYVGGSGSNALTFRYTVQVGDKADTLQYRSAPYALCGQSGCPVRSSCALLADATTPSLAVSLKLPRTGAGTDPNSGESLGSQRVSPFPEGRNTSVLSVEARSPAGEYGAGSVLSFAVVFSDRVLLGNTSAEALPRLRLSTGAYASYSGGNHGTTLTFAYLSSGTDLLTASFLGAEAAADDSSVLECLEGSGCSVLNQAGQVVSLNTSQTSFPPSGITLDPATPFITDVYTDKSTSLYEQGEYSVGEQVLIFVNFSKPVLVTGFDPRLPMDVTHPDRYALYSSADSSGTALAFLYTVAEGDVAADLQYRAGSLDLYGGYSVLYRLSDVPSTLADVVLPTPSPLARNGQVVSVNTLAVPVVLNVTSLPINSSATESFPTGSYTLYCGDSVLLRVDLDREVVAEGRSLLLLNLGDRYRHAHFVGYFPGELDLEASTAAQASNYTARVNKTASAPSRHLYYRYEVQLGDFSEDLDYTDVSALLPGTTVNNDPGSIRSAASASTVDADLQLPVPGHPGSLSGDWAVLRVDGRPPYLSSLTFLSPPGTYSTNSTLQLALTFSAPVVVLGGVPSLKLETGLVDQHAVYASGSGTSQLIFEYTPEPGDVSTDLDYHAERAAFRSANSSFHLNGARVLQASARPTLDALVWLNPPAGALVAERVESVEVGRQTGTEVERAEAGEVRFESLHVDRRGPDYQLRFSSVPEGQSLDASTVLTATQQPLDVSFSSERQLRPSLALSGHSVGASVAIDGDLLVLACPMCNSSVTPVQAIVSSAGEGFIQREVQTLQTHVERQPAKQSFHTTADVGATVGGGFKISQGGSGPSSIIPANADYQVLQSTLRFALPHLGNVSVLREAYIFCACENAFTWTLTFHDIQAGTLLPLSFDGTPLKGSGAAVVGPTVLQLPAQLGGTFTLSALGKTSSPIPVTAGVLLVKNAVAELGLTAHDVFITPADPLTLARTWTVTFDAYLDSYEMPLLLPDGALLTGGQTQVFNQRTRAGRHGPSGMAGFFSLSWRGNTTLPLPADATAAQVKDALETLPTINYVNVNRTELPVYLGYTWTVELVSVNQHSARGLVLQETANLEPLEAVNALIATEAAIEVQAVYALGSRNIIYGQARLGSFGAGAGAVHVYQRRNETWDEMATLRGNDTEDNNRFGSSVALQGEVLLVGAVGANMNGVPEKQAIFCSAAQGDFTISFRGWSTAPISYNVSREQLLAAIVSDPRFFSKLYTVRALDIDDWGGGPLCANNTAVLTFFAPVDGAELLLGEDTGPDLELLTLTELGLLSASDGDAVLQVSEVQKGSWRLHNRDSDPQQLGAAYIFRAQHECDATSLLCRKSNWVQEAQLFPTSSRVGSRFGYSVALIDGVAVVGAPGSFDEKGAAYVYEFEEVTGKWQFLQVMVYPLIVEGDHFGTSVAIDGDTIIIGAPDYNSGVGGVFVYTRPSTGGAFIAAQEMLPSAEFTLLAGARFGAAIAVEGNLVVASAPGYDDLSVYEGDTPGLARTEAGAVFLFERTSTFFNFKFLQRLQPSNVQQWDNFGARIALDSRQLVVSSLQEYTGPMQASKPVMEVRTSAAYSAPQPLGGSFRLSWLTQLDGTTFSTRSIGHATTAAQMRDILMADLPTGPLLVSRSRVDVYDGGYSWRVTFLDQDALTAFTGDATLLSGSAPAVTVEILNASPPALRGLTHVFQQSSAGLYVEQALLSPHVHQDMDRCGSSVGVSGSFVLVGCPNRDQSAPEQQSGAGFVFHLGLLAARFSAPFQVLEGNDAPVTVEHEADSILLFDEDLLFFLSTLDRNAFSLKQQFVRRLFGLPKAWDHYPDTFVERTLLAGRASARAQYYGSALNQSAWVQGMYDYRALSDYVPLNRAHAFLREYESEGDVVVTTADRILETPDEYVVLAISSPGLWPSVFGRLYGHLRIVDPADGNLWGEPRYRKLYDSVDVGAEGISALTNAAPVVSNAASLSPRSSAQSGADYASAVGLSESLGVMVVGAPLADVDGMAQAGKALFYRRDSGGNWTQQNTFFSSPTPELGGTRFGDSVALSRVFGRNISLLAIGEPSLNRIHVYVSEGADVGDSYTLDATLSHDFNSANAQDRFGERDTIAMHGFLLVVAAPGLETAWAYRRLWSNESAAWYWSEATQLRSSDYDFDVIKGDVLLHRQEFGHSVAVAGRSVLVGAPFADYDTLGARDKAGAVLVEEDWDTEGSSIRSVGRGSAYLFHSAPASQEVRIVSLDQLHYGQFSLQYTHQGETWETDPLQFDSSQDEIAAALTALPNVDEVRVEASFSETALGYEYSWTVTFPADWQDELDPLLPLWSEQGCANCTRFSALDERNTTQNSTAVVRVEQQQIAEATPLAQLQQLSASDRRNGDRFGWAVALDGDQIAVGAPGSAAMTSTSWGFEAGSLLGWSKTGTAFDFQPTFGDNAYLRGGREGVQGSGRLKAHNRAAAPEGLYYVGTYEKRPGSQANFRAADPAYAEGSTQGDGPTGTLSSDVFTVRGDRISFLLGGGCDFYSEYVELLVDGLSVGRLSGQCSERMRQVSFDTSLYLNRAAQLRIVDNATANWGHISVDDFRFSWAVEGASIASGNKKTTAGGLTETAQAGSVFLYHRGSNATASTGASLPCTSADKRLCLWSQEAKLCASDKRAGMQFGWAVAVEDAAGVVLVGAPFAAGTGFYKETPSVNPHYSSLQNYTDTSTVASLPFPLPPRLMPSFQSQPQMQAQRSGAHGVWSRMAALGVQGEERVYEEAGAAYSFVKEHQKLAADGSIAAAQSWLTTEQAKLQPPDSAARDHFGAALALDGMSVALGAVGQDGLLPDAGAAYLYSTEFTALSFSQAVYPILEGADLGVVVVTLLRDLRVYAGAMAIEFATSDLTARGVDAQHWAECQQMPVGERARSDCGDYQHTSGVVVIAAGKSTGGFTVNIMEDLCHERFSEYVQLTLSVPGSAALRSERLSAKIRIDDNDFGLDENC